MTWEQRWHSLRHERVTAETGRVLFQDILHAETLDGRRIFYENETAESRGASGGGGRSLQIARNLSTMPSSHPWLSPIRELHREIRAAVIAACKHQSVEAMSTVAEDGEGDTLYALDKVSEAVLVGGLARDA